MKKLLTILCVALLTFGVVGCSANLRELNKDSAKKLEETSQIVYEDENLIVTFKGVSDVIGQIGLNFTLENKSSDEIMVLPIDSSVNGTMVLFTSGIPAIIQGGKRFNQVWLCNPETIGISNSDEVKNIEFALDYGNTTDIIKIEMGK